MGSRNKFNFELFLYDFLSEKEQIKLHMVGPCMENIVVSKGNSVEVVKWTVGVEKGIPSSVNKDYNHKSSVVARAKDLYLAFVLDLDTTGCFLAHQEIRLLPRTHKHLKWIYHQNPSPDQHHKKL